MRFYSFTNFYLSSIQQGIQPAHCIADMFVKYAQLPASAILYDWAQNHKTMICLNGGNAAGIRAISTQLDRLGQELGLPTGVFHEDADSLDGAITSCGIIVPAPIYEFAATIRSSNSSGLFEMLLTDTGINETEMELAVLLNSCGLAK